jgi:hypothetical protein
LQLHHLATSPLSRASEDTTDAPYGRRYLAIGTMVAQSLR